MATRKGKENKTTALAKWDEKLAQQAAAAAEQEASTGGGQFFSLRGGKLSLDEAPIPNNEIACIIVDSILENTHYEDEFNADDVQSPSCFAFGRSEGEMSPHEDAPAPVDESCAECPNNKFGSADRGRGKACRNRRRLALIPCGTLKRDGSFDAFDAEELKSQTVAYLGLPPTSINSFGAYVKKLASVIKRPPHAVFTKISLVDDSKTMFKLVFEDLGPVPNAALPVVMELHDAQRDVIGFPYQQREEEVQPKKRGKKTSRRGSKKTTSRRSKY